MEKRYEASYIGHNMIFLLLRKRKKKFSINLFKKII